MNDQSGTAQLRFLEETATRLRQNGFTVEPIEDHHLPVCWEKGRLCRISGKGSVLYRQENVDNIRAQDALQTVIDTVKMTSEYMAILETAPRLKASGLDGDYRVLADFGDAVLAGHPTERGVQFVTWEWDFDREGVHHGHYFQDDYKAAKRDFTVRGILTSGDDADRGVFIQLAQAQELLNREGVVGSVEVSALTTPDNDLARKAAKNPNSLSVSEKETWYCTAYVSSIAYQIEEVMTDSVARPVRQVAQSEGTILEKTQLLMVLVTILALIASALAIANLVTAGVMERSSEIGLMKAVGAKDKQIISLFLTETIIVGLAGGVLGYGGGIVLAQAIGYMVFHSSIAFVPVVVGLVAVLVILVVLGASIPAIRYLLRLNAAEVLHGR